MVKESPLNPLWESLGATLKVERDWKIPAVFKDFLSEYTAVRKNVGLIDQSPRGKVAVTGKDRVTFLHRMLTNDVQSLGLGTGCYTALLSPAGKVLLDMNLLFCANSILLGVEIGMEKKLIDLLSSFIINEDVKLTDITQDSALIALQGPRSEALAHALFPGPFELEQKRQHANFQIADAEVMVVRIGRTGEWGYHLVIPKDKAVKVAERVLVVGKLYGLRPVGLGASEILRIEAGVLRYGIDIDENVTLPETGLAEKAASETKGCYPGQEVVARTKTYGGLNRKITGLIFEKTSLPAARDKIYSGKNEIGWITSACVSPSFDKGIALGYVAKGFFEKESAVEIHTAKGEIKAQTRDLPFTALDLSARPKPEEKTTLD